MTDYPPFISSYYYCIVPGCNSTNRTTPDKHFFTVPRNAKIREQWIRATRHDLKVSPLSDRTSAMCCEDHFDVVVDVRFEIDNSPCPIEVLEKFEFKLVDKRIHVCPVSPSHPQHEQLCSGNERRVSFGDNNNTKDQNIYLENETDCSTKWSTSTDIDSDLIEESLKQFPSFKKSSTPRLSLKEQYKTGNGEKRCGNIKESIIGTGSSVKAIYKAQQEVPRKNLIGKKTFDREVKAKGSLKKKVTRINKDKDEKKILQELVKTEHFLPKTSNKYLISEETVKRDSDREKMKIGEHEILMETVEKVLEPLGEETNNSGEERKKEKLIEGNEEVKEIAWEERKGIASEEEKGKALGEGKDTASERGKSTASERGKESGSEGGKRIAVEEKKEIISDEGMGTYLNSPIVVTENPVLMNKSSLSKLENNKLDEIPKQEFTHINSPKHDPSVDDTLMMTVKINLDNAKEQLTFCTSRCCSPTDKMRMFSNYYLQNVAKGKKKNETPKRDIPTSPITDSDEYTDPLSDSGISDS